MKWQSMDSIPMDGPNVLVYLEGTLMGVHIHELRMDRGIPIIGNLFIYDAPKVLYWMPRPNDPEES